jgi:putative solute:sodium symporter small subunit
MSVDPPAVSLYWRKTLRLSAAVLVVWLLVTLAVGLFGRSMDFRLLGWPFGFWVTAQLSLVVFCVLVWAYALAMDRLDQAHGGHAED